jgi:hypothetical protein
VFDLVRFVLPCGLLDFLCKQLSVKFKGQFDNDWLEIVGHFFVLLLIDSILLLFFSCVLFVLFKLSFLLLFFCCLFVVF